MIKKYTCVLFSELPTDNYGEEQESLCELMEIIGLEGSIKKTQIEEYILRINEDGDLDEDEIEFEMERVNTVLKFMNDNGIDLVCENYFG